QAVLNLHHLIDEAKEEEPKMKMKRIAIRVDDCGDFVPPQQEEESRAVRSILIPYIGEEITERDLFDSVQKLGDVQEVMVFRGVISRALVVFSKKETALTVSDRSLITVRGNTYFVDSATEESIPSM
ncbi:hypothetical protein PFISCL1PPCAC_3164, partial [Pristionchus fissidentatus]